MKKSTVSTLSATFPSENCFEKWGEDIYKRIL